MGRHLAVAVVLLFFSVDARAGPPRLERPGADCTSGNCASSQHNTAGNTADYIKTLVRPVTISEIGVSVRDGRAKLIEGQELSGAEVIEVAAESPAAAAGIRSVRTAVRTIIVPGILLLQTVDQGFMFDNGDVIFAADGERVRNTLDLVDRVAGLARGARLYLTIARQGRRVQSCVVVALP